MLFHPCSYAQRFVGFVVEKIRETHAILASTDQNKLLAGGIPTPLKNDGVRQLFILFPIDGKIKAQYGKS